ncbi:MAG: PA0069 family radical SAM protein [Bacteroidetes bacterium]|nr:PA0069 family radical SAM protein [Bacteroidota bacterium]MBK9526060.1 PA0069 family radical SAM protein [Bacteroidota bacterium]MBK9542818.1 PA0069 family radical SAM protein [Bacteroidota bacterium]MBP6401082.1 PA0069 family radical SAM protein [Bacteroidia bacterium]MBP6648088.1 PA0069 family radical SAM protein [Bacteroidia bacterium]
MLKDRNTDNFIKGRGAQLNTKNKYLRQELVTEHIEGLDEPLELSHTTQYFLEYPKKMVNRIDSPDIPSDFSMNPYQGCEHGCVYCYARNTHQYWGYSAGLDFESKIIVKPEAPALLEAELRKKSWKPAVIMLSGNTDCYQPAERKWKLTRRMLEVLLRFRNPVSMITKNNLILRDLDILKELAAMDLVHVAVSITSLDETLRLQLEPRTTTAKNRLKVIETLSKNNIPTMVMVAPIIPGLNSHEIPAIVEAAANCGARNAGMTIVRLNDSVAEIFKDWIHKTYPDRAEKVLNQIAECHGGKLSDSRFGTRMKGEGKLAESIRQLLHHSVDRFMANRTSPPYNKSLFRVPSPGGQMELFM